MRNMLFAVLTLALMSSVEVHAQASLAGQWILTYDQTLNGVVDPVHVHKFSVTGSGKTFTGRYVGHEKKATFNCTLYAARGITLIQMIQFSPNFYRLYSGIKVSPTRFQGTYHGVGNGPPGWRGDWRLERSAMQPSANDIQYVNGFQGVWQSNWGRLTFKVDGIRVMGSYTHDKGRIEATLSPDGRTMQGLWLEAPSYKPPRDGGRVIFHLSPDGKTITGHWWYGQAQEGGDWTGKKIQ